MKDAEDTEKPVDAQDPARDEMNVDEQQPDVKQDSGEELK